jgi:hypothetical protein
MKIHTLVVKFARRDDDGRNLTDFQEALTSAIEEVEIHNETMSNVNVDVVDTKHHACNDPNHEDGDAVNAWYEESDRALTGR